MLPGRSRLTGQPEEDQNGCSNGHQKGISVAKEMYILFRYRIDEFSHVG